MTILALKVKPNARQQRIIRQLDGAWLVQLKSPPTDGKANREPIALLAQELGLLKSQISIKTGQTRPIKRVEIDATK